MNEKRIGALQVALGATCWSFAGVFCKYLPWSAWTIIGMRSLVCALALRLTRKSWKVKITRGTLLGAIGVSVTGMLFLLSTKLTTAANAIVLQYAVPVFVILFCWIAFHQKPTRADVITTICVLIGVVLCSLSGVLSGGGRLLGDLLAIASSVTYTLVFVSARFPDSSAQDYVYLGALMCAPLSLCAFFDPNMTLQIPHLLAITAMGACLAIGYYLVSRSLNRVDPITSALLANLEPVLNPVWTYLFLGENPGVLTIIGACIVIFSVTAYSILGLRNRKPV